MTEQKASLREANARAVVEGILSEKKLETKVVDGKKVIRGNLVIQTDETNFITFDVFVNALTKAGTANKTYKSMETIMEEYHSIAEVGKENATRVKVTNGSIRPRTYFDDNGQHDILSYSSNFFNRVKDDVTPTAEFEVELFIASISREVDATGDETGRVIVKGWMPTYSGIEPLTLVAPAEDDIANSIEANFEPGQTVEFYGEIVNRCIIKDETIPVKIGKPKVRTKRTYKNELLITGASEAYEEGMTPQLPYDAEVIKKAIREREIRLDEMKNKTKSTTTPSTSSAPASASGRKLPF